MLPPFALERYFARYEFCTEHLLCSSDCESMTVGDLLALEPGASLDDVWLGYTESLGAPALRERIAALYEHVTPDDVLVHVGAEEAIHNFAHACLGVGDHVFVHAPAYQALHGIARHVGCEVAPFVAEEHRGWALEEVALKANTRAVFVNTPHNPTGWLMPRRQLEALAHECHERGVVLFSDEVYRFSEAKPEDRLPAACDLSESAVSLGVLSKSFGLPGLRIGWTATRNRAVYARMRDYKDYTTICAPAPSEYLATIALGHVETLTRRARAIIDRNLALADAFFARHADRFAWIAPQAGPVAFPRLLHEEADAFCHRMVTEHGVLLLPGSVFGDDWRHHFRIGLGRESFPEGLARLEEGLG